MCSSTRELGNWKFWGVEYSPNIEKVHFRFCRYLLGLGSNVNNEAVLGECRRFPLSCTYMKRGVSNWLRLLEMDDSRYPKACYEMLRKLDEAGKVNWVTQIKQLLMRYGFANVWLEQQVGNSELFLSLFSQRLKDCYRKEWHAKINESSR